MFRTGDKIRCIEANLKHLRKGDVYVAESVEHCRCLVRVNGVVYRAKYFAPVVELAPSVVDVWIAQQWDAFKRELRKIMRELFEE